MVSVLLLHPPLLGPAVWRPVAAHLTGHRVAVPDLRPALDPPESWYARAATLAAAALAAPPAGDPAATPRPVGSPDPVSTAAAGAVPGPARAAAAGSGGVPGVGPAVPGGGDVVVVAHSGAGVLVPLVADRVGAAAAVFVDAVLPGRPTSDQLRAFLAGLPLTGGRLPPWSSWWGPDELAGLVPDAGLRTEIEAEQVGLPLAFYDQTVPVPASWPPPRVGYLQLSPAYVAEAAEAADHGWPTRVLPGGHLDLVTRPAEVAALVRELAGV